MILFQVLIRLEKFRIAFIVSRVVYLQLANPRSLKSKNEGHARSGHVIWSCGRACGLINFIREPPRDQHFAISNLRS